MLSLCFINEEPHHEDALGSGGMAPLLLTSVLDGGEWSASRLCRFTPVEIATGTHWIRGWVKPKIEKILSLLGIERRSFSPKTVSIPALLLRYVTHFKWSQDGLSISRFM
jgi:hypothetical protein